MFDHVKFGVSNYAASKAFWHNIEAVCHAPEPRGLNDPPATPGSSNQ